MRLFAVAAAALLSGCAVLNTAREVWAELKAEEALWAELECDSYSALFWSPAMRQLFTYNPPPEYPAGCKAIGDARRARAQAWQRCCGSYGLETITIYEADTGRTRTITAPKGTQVIR